MKLVNYLFLLIMLFMGIKAISEIVTYLLHPENYFLGSEAMISNGGNFYKSEMYFLFFHSLTITILVISILLALKKSFKYSIAISVVNILIRLLLFMNILS